MNVQRFTGRDNRAALDQVRQHLGPDALVLSSRRTGDVIEICATDGLPDLSKAAAAPASRGSENEIQLAQLKRELASLRETLQQALGERRWQDSAGKAPVAATVAQRLTTLGLGRVLAGELADNVDTEASLESAWQQVTGHLVHRLHSLSHEELAGFRVKAVIGASGSGKTRTAEALLQDAASRLSPDQIVAVHCGDQRQETLMTDLATRLNIRQYGAQEHAELADILVNCRWAREIIIDTPALSPSQGADDPVLALLAKQRGGLAAFVTMPANSSRDYQREIIGHCSCLPLAGVVTTKIDEASSLGAIIDLVITEELALAGRYDLRRERVLPVSGTEMLANAKRLAKRSRDRKARQLQVAV